MIGTEITGRVITAMIRPEVSVVVLAAGDVVPVPSMSGSEKNVVGSSDS